MEKKIQNIAQEIRSNISTVAEVPEDAINGDTSFTKDLGFDSMMGLELVAALENKYTVKITEEEMVKLDNLDQTVALVQSLLD